MLNKKNRIKNQFGVTLIETIIALNILVIGIVASLTLSTSSLRFSQASEQSLVMVSLAREGLEIVRTIRDTEGLSALPIEETNFVVDSLSNFNLDTAVNVYYQINYCEQCRLYLNTNGVYNHSNGIRTDYKRLIKVLPVSPTERRAISMVSWEERGRIHQYQLETYFTDWR